MFCHDFVERHRQLVRWRWGSHIYKARCELLGSDEAMIVGKKIRNGVYAKRIPGAKEIFNANNDEVELV